MSDVSCYICYLAHSDKPSWAQHVADSSGKLQHVECCCSSVLHCTECMPKSMQWHQQCHVHAATGMQIESGKCQRGLLLHALPGSRCLQEQTGHMMRASLRSCCRQIQRAHYLAATLLTRLPWNGETSAVSTPLCCCSRHAAHCHCHK